MSAAVFPVTRRTLLALLLSAAAPFAPGATAPGQMKNVAMRLSATGTVVAVDPAARRLTLKGAREEATYRVDPKVQNLQDLRVGQRVRIDYVAAMVVTLRRGNAPAPETGSAAPSGPGAVVPQGAQVVTQVLAVDRKAATLRLRGPEGRVSDFRVQDPAELVGVKPGDQVAAVLHEAVVVGLETLPK